MNRMKNKKNNILIVDDEKLLRVALEHILKQEGYDVTTAKTGQEAIERASEKKFHLVITDLRMPDVDGFELLEWLKNNDADCNVIVMSAYGSGQVENYVINKGASRFLNKPFDFEDMRYWVKNTLN